MHSALVFSVYTRDQCQLCDKLLQELHQHLTGQDYRVRCIDIDTDPVLQHRYAGRIPVLCCQGAFVCEYFLNKAAVDACLARHHAVN